MVAQEETEISPQTRAEISAWLEASRPMRRYRVISSMAHMKSFKNATPSEGSYHRGVSSWPDSVRKARALDQIIDVIAEYLPPDSGMTKADVVARVIEIIETKAGHQFLKLKVIDRNGE